MPATKRRAPKKSSQHRKGANPRWVANVKTVSTFPPPGLFTKSASTIAKALASRKVSPKGPGSGMRMLTYYINRAGRGLSASRRAELERAKLILSRRIQKERTAKRKKAA
jgi:hypothetical protein